jgi:CheY-like chemotaxis protein
MILPSNFFTTQSVLVVDDIDTIRSAVKGMLQMLGCKDISTATNGERALEVCLHHQFDFILCDFNLGKGKDGYQLFEELKLRKLLKNNTLFILISAETAIQIIHGIVELQPDDYLLKPFSYKKLESRLIKALEKRKVLGIIYDAVMANDYEGALDACATVTKLHPSFSLAVTRLKAEVFLKLKRFKEALALYEKALQTREFGWARLGKAITYYHLNELPKAIFILKQLAEVLETRVEALNWLANIYVKQNRLELVEDTLLESVKISPKNIPRQRALANFSVLNGDWDVALRCFKTVLGNTRFSIHENIEHHFNYVHCILDKAQTESELQRAKLFSQVQAILRNASKRFDKEIFAELEKIAVARIAILRDVLNEANATLLDCNQEVIINCGKNSILQLARAWFELGDYEHYETLMALLPKDSNDENIENISEMLRIEKASKESDGRIAKLLELNQQGLALYKSGLYQASTAVFLEAFRLVPNNFQLALNLGQSISKGWPSNETHLLKKVTIKRCINIIESQPQPLDKQVKARYDSFEYELKKMAL